MASQDLSTAERVAVGPEGVAAHDRSTDVAAHDRSADPEGASPHDGEADSEGLVDPEALADRVLAGGAVTEEEAVALLGVPDAEVLGLVHAAGRLRRHWFGNSVKLNYLVNLKSGRCAEDCGYCSQRLGSEADVLNYPWLSTDEAVRAARAGMDAGARRVCLVSSGRGPSNRDLDRVGDIVDGLRQADADVEVCACLGLLKEGQAERLAAAGVDAYNHNLNTAASHYDDICSTHTYADREDTVGKAHGAGLSACSGLIAGMGETAAELVDVTFALRRIGSDSVPVNFLMPFDGTPLAGSHTLAPLDCLRILAMVRFVHPDTEVRIAGGREDSLRSLQPLGLEVANSIFLGDYLTSEGQAGAADLQMIADAGFVPVGEEDDPAYGAAQAGQARQAAQTGRAAQAAQTAPGTPGAQTAPGTQATPAIRRRGAGTALAPNA